MEHDEEFESFKKMLDQMPVYGEPRIRYSCKFADGDLCTFENRYWLCTEKPEKCRDCVNNGGLKIL